MTYKEVLTKFLKESGDWLAGKAESLGTEEVQGLRDARESAIFLALDATDLPVGQPADEWNPDNADQGAS